MADYEKVTRGLKRCVKGTCPSIFSEEYRECEYTVGLYCGKQKLMLEAIELIEEQKQTIEKLSKKLNIG